MKHACPQTLTALEPLLRRIREHSSLVERMPGSFYQKPKAFADIKLSVDKRIRTITPQTQSTLLSLIAEVLEP
jgi:hypothetical protein